MNIQTITAAAGTLSYSLLSPPAVGLYTPWRAVLLIVVVVFLFTMLWAISAMIVTRRCNIAYKKQRRDNHGNRN